MTLDKNHCRDGCQSSSLKLTYSLNRALHSPSTMSGRLVPYACILCKVVWQSLFSHVQLSGPTFFRCTLGVSETLSFNIHSFCWFLAKKRTPRICMENSPHKLQGYPLRGPSRTWNPVKWTFFWWRTSFETSQSVEVPGYKFHFPALRILIHLTLKTTLWNRCC